jgi:hypothetical protein
MQESEEKQIFAPWSKSTFDLFNSVGTDERLPWWSHGSDVVERLKLNILDFTLIIPAQFDVIVIYTLCKYN